MTTTKVLYAADASITCTINSLASSFTVGRASTFVDNSSNLYLDALVSGIVAVGSGTIANTQAAYYYAYGSTDLSNYTEGVTGSDASFTINNPTGLKLLGVIPMPTQSKTYHGGPWSVAAVFGGVLPERWGIVVCNDSGIAFASSGCSSDYMGINATIA